MKFHKIDIRGKFWLPKETSSSIPHNGTEDEGRMFYSEAEDSVYFGDQDEWILVTERDDVLSDGTRMTMGSYPLPDYWNVDYTATDAAIILGDNGVDVGNTYGSWTITGVVSGGSHDHGGLTGNPDNSSVLGASDIYTSVAKNNHKHSLLVDGVHSHTFDGTWRPKYTKFLIVRYDL